MRDANGNLITPGRRVRRRDDGTYSVMSGSDDGAEDSLSPTRKATLMKNKTIQRDGAGGNSLKKAKTNKPGFNRQRTTMPKEKAVMTSTHWCQTDLHPLVQLACEMLLHELMTNFDGSDDAVLKRIKNIVERILAKSK